jgi:hypothetical protein
LYYLFCIILFYATVIKVGVSSKTVLAHAVHPGLVTGPSVVGHEKKPILVSFVDDSQLPPDELSVFQAQRILSLVEEPLK